MMLERLSIRHLRTLRLLYETKSMRETASLVFRSQPAVSLMIKDLEEIVGFRLIYHRQGAILFTEKGERFVKATEAIEQQLKTSIDDLKTTPPTAVRFGVTQDVYAACADDLDVFLEHGVELLPMKSGDVLQGCRAGQLDLGVAKTEAPLANAARTWPNKLNWIGGCRKDKALELALLDVGCFYHHLALKLFENAEPGAVELSICDDWDEIADRLEQGGVTIVSSRWTKKLERWPDSRDLPLLPVATMNLIQAAPPSAAAQWASNKVAAGINAAINENESALARQWADRGIRMYR